MYDMGFRDYNPGLNRFLLRDTYNGALDDLSLGLDPWTANRYAFTDGNPISNVELDGHIPIDMSPEEYGKQVSAAAAKAAKEDEERKWWDIYIEPHETAFDLTAMYLRLHDLMTNGGRGKVTTSRTDNYIRGGSYDNPEKKPGYADVLYGTEDKVYIWEVKHAGSPAEQQASAQLRNYIKYLQKQLREKGDNRIVELGFSLSPRGGVNRSNPREFISVSSRGNGVEVYRISKINPPRPAGPHPVPVPGPVPVPTAAPGPAPFSAPQWQAPSVDWGAVGQGAVAGLLAGLAFLGGALSGGAAVQ